ncbi:hypothetical protein ACMD2_09730 [Ananas comosus]|uniref:Btz domain-containing protein n=1 Tax=Ananas comosus TaxID=4615 RepID=A0A199UVI8_ANACO|nr:hypothetical protein ACMD2_09730 [Ananas comosus]
MASTAAEVEYESDPEDAPLPTMRRREAASDDEDGEGAAPPPPKDLRGRAGSDVESDGQGGAQVYDEEEEFEEDEGFEEEADEDLEEAEEDDGGEFEERREVAASKTVSGGEAGKETVGDEQGEEGEEKLENEPYAVPTTGAFYMHDDRFQENTRGRHRRMFGGRKLDSKDERAWVHDRFEEMNLQDTRYDQERRRSRGRFRGRGGGRTRGGGRGYYRGGRSRNYYDDAHNQNRPPKVVRGRGPRRYEPSTKNKSENSTIQPKQSAKPQESTPNASAARQPIETLNFHPETAAPKKQAFASSLNSASPPFYPSGSSNQEISVAQMKDVRGGNSKSTISTSIHMESNATMPQSGSVLRGKAVVDTGGHETVYSDDSHSHRSGYMLPSKNAGQSSNPRIQGRNLSSGGFLANHTSSPHQVARVSSQGQAPKVSPIVQQRPVQTGSQPALRSQSGSGNQASPPPQHSSTNLVENGETDSPSGSNTSKTQLVGKGKITSPGTGRGSFLYSGAQVIGATGAMGLVHGDQGFAGAPTLLPVMQFGGQHPGGLGVPAVGMALPGYVAQSQLGFGNSEMTWVPVLAGAGGALGASYCPPYIALDGSYYARPSGQTSSSASSRETSTSKASSSTKSPPRAELVNEELGQRQNKPRRYSEMNFGQ